MVLASVDETNLYLTIEGIDKLWAMKGSLTVPLAHISDVRANPAEAHDWWKGLKLVGSQMPHLVAGTFLYHGERVFWDVHDPDMSVGIMLHDDRYRELIIQVDDPEDVVDMIKQATMT